MVFGIEKIVNDLSANNFNIFAMNWSVLPIILNNALSPSFRLFLRCFSEPKFERMIDESLGSTIWTGQLIVSQGTIDRFRTQEGMEELI